MKNSEDDDLESTVKKECVKERMIVYWNFVLVSMDILFYARERVLLVYPCTKSNEQQLVVDFKNEQYNKRNTWQRSWGLFVRVDLDKVVWGSWLKARKEASLMIDQKDFVYQSLWYL